jgi:hypothetical protein
MTSHLDVLIPRSIRMREKKGRLEDVPINYSAVIQPTMSTGVNAMVVVALSFLK